MGTLEWRDAQRLEGQPDTLRKGIRKHGTVYHKIGKENRVVKIQTLAGNGGGVGVGVVRASKEMLPGGGRGAGSRKWDTEPFPK